MKSDDFLHLKLAFSGLSDGRELPVHDDIQRTYLFQHID